MLNFNPELLSNEATHVHPTYGAIKVFTLKVEGTDRNGRLFRTAEIMTGEKAGDWLTVYADEIQKIER
jgi:hypothetical protein